jgi:CheY-like chemotaxis protein
LVLSHLRPFFNPTETLMTNPALQPDVVVIDDEPTIVDLVCDLLTDVGLNATSCPHGRDAFACIRVKQPKVLVLDLQMPDVDGVMLFRMVRGDQQLVDTPVVFLTANAHLIDRLVPDYAAQNAVVVPKPMRIDKFVRVVQSAMP